MCIVMVGILWCVTLLTWVPLVHATKCCSPRGFVLKFNLMVIVSVSRQSAAQKLLDWLYCDRRHFHTSGMIHLRIYQIIPWRPCFFITVITVLQTMELQLAERWAGLAPEADERVNPGQYIREVQGILYRKHKGKPRRVDRRQGHCIRAKEGENTSRAGWIAEESSHSCIYCICSPPATSFRNVSRKGQDTVYKSFPP